jgi:hypothetical protein
MKANNDHYQIITGKITDLQVIDTDIALFGKGTFASLPLLGQLALGNTTETANQRGMATNQSTFSLNILSNFQRDVLNNRGSEIQLHVDAVVCS